MLFLLFFFKIFFFYYLNDSEQIFVPLVSNDWQFVVSFVDDLLGVGHTRVSVVWAHHQNHCTSPLHRHLPHFSYLIESKFACLVYFLKSNFSLLHTKIPNDGKLHPPPLIPWKEGKNFTSTTWKIKTSSHNA